MNIAKWIIRKIFNYVYGFEIEKLNPAYEHEMYYYTPCHVSEPSQGTEGSVGYDFTVDLYERYNTNELIIYPGEMYKLDTSLMIQLPAYHEGRLCSRSGLSSQGLLLTNGVGEVDWDYRGYIGFPVKNISDKPIVVKHGERIGQIIVTPVRKLKWIRVERPEDLSKTLRGTGGFGHTGKIKNKAKQK